jgi:hypothetical protein
MFQVGGGCPPLQEKEDTVLYQRGVDEMRSAVGAVVGGGEFVSCEAVMCSTVGQLGWAHLPVLVHVLRPDSMRFVEVTRDPGHRVTRLTRLKNLLVRTYSTYSTVEYRTDSRLRFVFSILFFAREIEHFGWLSRRFDV